ncbi:carboxy terminal-processing peptidase [Pseudomonadota bacterium]
MFKKRVYIAALLVVGIALSPWWLPHPTTTTQAAPSHAPIVDPTTLIPSEKQERATQLINQYIELYHYKKIALDDELSSVVLDRYIANLDRNRSYFVASDIKQFERFKLDLDDHIKSSRLEPPYSMFVVFRERVSTYTNYAISLLDKDFNFEKDESFTFDRRKSEWATDHEELKGIWRKRVKNDVLNLRLAKQDGNKIKETLKKRYQRINVRTQQINSDDIYQMFINAYMNAIEPHTAYFSPRMSENFRIRMSLSLEGIGAVLQTENEFTLVRQIVTGGPAELSDKLHAGDRITGVGQGQVEAITDVVGWRLDDVVDLIRGKKGTLVRLEILPKDVGPEGPSKIISITRNKIKLEDKAASKQVIDLPNMNLAASPGETTKRIGVIRVPTFYIDFQARTRGDKDYRSTTRDVQRLLAELQKEKVNGIVVDLRGNGGGSLIEATSLTGLFIASGPIVQVQGASGKLQVNRDPDPGISYRGPLAVLVDRNSASASEIFSAAIQDYGRGIIIGETTFGKGTVQNLVNLDRFVDPELGSMGQLKLTIAQFFRINGNSTQHRGVIPDIIFPTALGTEKYGERSLDNALPWTTVIPASYKRYQQSMPTLFDLTKSNHKRRIKDDPSFQVLLETAKTQLEALERTEVSLLESRRKSERDLNAKVFRHSW